MKYGFPANVENDWYGESPYPVGPKGKICQNVWPASTNQSTNLYASLEKQPIPYFDGRLEIANNIPAVLKIMQFIYNHIMYAELNTKSDFCQVCEYDGEIQIVSDDDGKLIWECPNCGNRDQNKMNVARRTCGYIGSNYWNQGRTQEIKDRVIHLSTTTIK